jgi:hypothetical protein
MKIAFQAYPDRNDAPATQARRIILIKQTTQYSANTMVKEPHTYRLEHILTTEHKYTAEAASLMLRRATPLVNTKALARYRF